MKVRASVPLAVVLAVAWAVFPASKGLAQLICEPGWTPEYNCLEHCGPCPNSGGGAIAQPNFQQQFGQAFMQGAVNGFISAMQRNAAMRQQAQQAFQQETARRQQEAAEQQRVAAQQRIDAMFARLDSELKLSGLPFHLTMQGMDAPGPDDLHMKGMDDPGPDDLHVKIGDDSATATGYGIKGLPGVYVGGPAGGATTNTPDAAANNTASSDGSSGNPNLASGPGAGTTGQGIAGLPGIYLDGAQPSQAPELAQAAQGLPAGPERDMTEDTALHAALHNPDLTSETQDPQVQNFQKADLNYEQALHTDTQASQDYAAAQAQATADQSAVATAKAQLASLQPTVEQQAALTNMLNAAKTDEAASEAARQIFENADVHLSMARTQATGALASLPQSPNAPPIHLSRNALSRNATPVPLRLPTPGGYYASAPGHPLPVSPATPVAAQPLPVQLAATPAQLCAQLAGAQNALRRLMETQTMHNDDLAEWGQSVDEASDDAWGRGLDMARDFMGKGVNAYLQGKIDGSDADIQALYLRVSNEKNPSNMADTQKEWEAMEQHKLYLQEALERAKKDQKQLDVLAEERDFHDWTKDNKGDLNGNLEGVRQIVDNLIGDEDIQKELGISEASDAIKYGESIVDSGYDILSEVLAAQRIKQLNRNAEQFLQAQRALQHRIETTVAQLNAAGQNTPPGTVRCNMVAAR
ncbi:MAG: hypothetical protein ACYCSP_13390 [Acidobacteriaceae bacterium]